MVRLLIDVVVLFGVDICESSTNEYIEYSVSPKLGWRLGGWQRLYVEVVYAGGGVWLVVEAVG